MSRRTIHSQNSAHQVFQVLSAFLASAYLSLIVSIIAFTMSLIPPELTNHIDPNIFRFKPRNSKWNSLLKKKKKKTILSISDQQIVSGIAIILAGFIQANTISTYHWHTVVYLAWMSSMVHLTTLTVLRGHMPTSPVVRTIRVIGMTILFVLLLTDLLPTISYDYQYSIGDDLCKYPDSFHSVTKLKILNNQHLHGNIAALMLSLQMSDYPIRTQ